MDSPLEIKKRLCLVFILQCSFKGGGVNVAGKMDWTFTVNGIPSGRIGGTEELRFQADPDDGIRHGKAFNPFGGFPGGTAGGTPHHFDGCDAVIVHFNRKFRCPEPLSIFAQPDLPGKTASRRWGKNPFPIHFFPGGHYRDALSAAYLCQVVRKIGVFQKVENQIPFNFFRQVVSAVVDNRRQVGLDGMDDQLKMPAAEFTNTFDLGFSTAVLLKNDDGLWLGIFFHSDICRSNVSYFS
jgi:hypothetical protein